MSKTLVLTTLALAALAAAAIPTASACQSTNEVAHYAVCVLPAGTVAFAKEEKADAEAFAGEESADAVAFAQWAVEQAPLP